MNHDLIMDLESLAGQRVASRLSQGDTSVFVAPGSSAATHAAIRQRLGWLDAPSGMAARAGEIDAFTAGVADDRLTEVYLLGMGGSSLCAGVLRALRGDAAATRPLVVLDTTDERTIRRATEAMSPTRALFLVASKSGSTIEVTALERHFWAVMTKALGPEAGRHFAAITDPDTTLGSLAASRRYRHTFINPADIGGRFSALSLFGLVPAALVGYRVDDLLAPARAMADRCRVDQADNPGLALGAFMATQAAAGRDKLTLLLPPALLGLGGWIEQLVAESTGKNGRGILPVVGEPRGRFADYGADRAFVTIATPEAPADLAMARRIEGLGHPVFRIEMTLADLGAEFFRWEFATAVACTALGVNPFDEPDVRDAKVRTQALLDVRRTTGDFRIEPPFERRPAYFKRAHRPSRAADAPARTGRYVALLDFLPDEPWRPDVIDKLRGVMRRRSGIATTHGVGPRYLHATGQYHKGGPDAGLFVLLTADDGLATPVPETDYTFSMLKRAQALGDFEALAAAGRDVIHFHLEGPTTDLTEEFQNLALGRRGPGDRRRTR
jgi:glucose-6-phosphate isomerase